MYIRHDGTKQPKTLLKSWLIALLIMPLYPVMSALAFLAVFWWLDKPYRFELWHGAVWLTAGGIFWYLAWAPERGKRL